MRFWFVAGCFLLTLLTPRLGAAEEQPSGKGIGPIEHVDIGAAIDPALAKTGAGIFEAKCTACHKLDERYVGPALRGVSKRREPEWIMNWVLNSDEMIKSDPIAMALLEQFLTAMPNQNINKEDARAILEYFRSVDSEAPKSDTSKKPKTKKK